MWTFKKFQMFTCACYSMHPYNAQDGHVCTCVHSCVTTHMWRLSILALCLVWARLSLCLPLCARIADPGACRESPVSCLISPQDFWDCRHTHCHTLPWHRLWDPHSGSHTCVEKCFIHWDASPGPGHSVSLICLPILISPPSYQLA